MLYLICVILYVMPAVSCGTEVMDYLVSYGHLDGLIPQNNKQIMTENLKSALIEFQTFVGPKPTGQLDNAIYELMFSPRCGNKETHYSRQKRFAFLNANWDKLELTYSIIKYPEKGDLSSSSIDEEVERVFATWAEETNLSFQPVLQNADIIIEFISRNSSTNYRNNVTRMFGWTEPPPRGIIHMLEDFNWTIRQTSGRNLYNGLLHEVGHVLGLHHSNVTGSIMQPYVNLTYQPDFRLHDDDISGIQALYGKRTYEPPNLCTDSSFDAIFHYPTSVTYVLKGEHCWKLTPDGIASGYPRLISRQWPGVPSHVDAATATSSGLIYFFKGDKYWTYNDATPCHYNPSNMSEGWPGIPIKVDGAMWAGHSIFYFFKGEFYWQFDSALFQASGPHPVTDWGGMEGHFTDVLYVNSGYIYFFKGGLYYRYNCNTGLIDYFIPNQPSYPRPIGYWWFHCQKATANVQLSNSNVDLESPSTNIINMIVDDTESDSSLPITTSASSTFTTTNSTEEMVNNDTNSDLSSSPSNPIISTKKLVNNNVTLPATPASSTFTTIKIEEEMIKNDTNGNSSPSPSATNSAPNTIISTDEPNYDSLPAYDTELVDGKPMNSFSAVLLRINAYSGTVGLSPSFLLIVSSLLHYILPYN